MRVALRAHDGHSLWVSTAALAGAGGDPMLRIGYVKAFMDGTLGSRTARLLDGSGVEITTAARLADLVRRAERAGFALAVHAIGDRANRAALDAFAAAATPGARHRIQHAQCIAPEDVSRFAALGIAASVQCTHATSDRDLAERIWADRLEHAYPFRSLLAAGAARRRLGRAGRGARPARRAARRGVAHGLGGAPAVAAAAGDAGGRGARVVHRRTRGAELRRHRRGRLRAGFDADLVVLDRDPLADPPASVAGARVVATTVAGEWTHAPGW